MTERAVKHNPEEAARLFERGVGAARGGQRRLAATMLSRAVQLDPKHEQAWLWLSGVLDDPNEIAFCLRSVLSINPNSERARQGLAWLEQRKLVAAQAGEAPEAPASTRGAAPRPSAPSPNRRAHHDREGWWVTMRRNRREMSRAWQVVLVGAILLLSFTLGLNWWLRDTIARTKAENMPTAVVVVVPGATAMPTVIPVFKSSLAASDDARALAYLSALERERAQLRSAVDAYREATSKLGNSSVLHATAARKLRGTVDDVAAKLNGLNPPPALARAHAEYLKGLDEERAAMDDMLQFYGSFSVQLVNRAVLRLEEANQRIERARAAFALTQQRANNNALPPLTAR